MPPTPIRTVLGLVLAACLAASAGCGFQLRGQSLAAGELGRVYISGGNVVRDELEIQLQDAGATLADSAGEADVVVTITNERFDERVLTVDPETGKAREYEVEYELVYSARSGDGRVDIPRDTVTLVRDYVFDADAVIGKSRERGVLREEMRRDAAQQILGRLDRVLGG